MTYAKKAVNETVSTHSRPKAAAKGTTMRNETKQFQHTAARRRLHIDVPSGGLAREVSTHSRPKAAAHLLTILFFR